MNNVILIYILSFLILGSSFPCRSQESDLVNNEVHVVALNAAFDGNIETLKAVISDLDINKIRGEHNETLLHSAVFGGKPDVINLLISAGADIEARDGYDHTPLQVVIATRNSELAKLFINAGSRVNEIGERQSSLLLLACDDLVAPVDASIIELLAKAGSDTTIRNSTGDAPLHMLVKQGNLSGVEALIRSGADIELRGQQHTTALINAAAKGNTEIMKVLIKAGAEIDAVANVEKNWSMTAISAAAMEGKVEAVALLLKAGAGINANKKEHVQAIKELIGEQKFAFQFNAVRVTNYEKIERLLNNIDTFNYQ